MVSTGHTPLKVPLGNFGSAPVVIAGPLTFNGYQSATLELQNITVTGLMASVREWNYLDGAHFSEDFSLLALASGRYDQADGSVWELSHVDLSGTQNWQTVTFNTPFAGTRKVFVTVQTINDTNASFEVALFEEDARQNGHPTEQLGYLADHNPTPGGTAELNGVSLNQSLSTVTLDHRWTTLAEVEMQLQEDQSHDSETEHTYAEQFDL